MAHDKNVSDPDMELMSPDKPYRAIFGQSIISGQYRRQACSTSEYTRFDISRLLPNTAGPIAKLKGLVSKFFMATNFPYREKAYIIGWLYVELLIVMEAKTYKYVDNFTNPFKDIGSCQI